MKMEEREFVVDSRASMQMLSRKDLRSAELETVKMSKSPTTVVKANGEVQTNEDATVYVKELDLSLTIQILKDTENSANITDIPTSGLLARNQNSPRVADG